ncbi:MAG: MoxR family ATPase, partial [Planctomycetota bacterium]
GQHGSERVHDIANYIVKGRVWEAFQSEAGAVLLIDEIDKADIEFPNDLLLELDRMEFFVYETQETVRAVKRPVVIITSNDEKELPDAFLRRCFFHYIQFPEPATMAAIVRAHFPELHRDLLNEALGIFFGIREVQGLKKRPSTSELLDWLRLLVIEKVRPADLKDTKAQNRVPDYIGSMVKNEQDMERLARWLGSRGWAR